MTKLSLPLLPLILWSVVSLVVLILGIGFAGGISALSMPPDNAEFLGVVLWWTALIFIIAPFPLLLLHFLTKPRSR